MVEFKNEQLNYFKIAFLVTDEFPKALRETFKSMWNKSYGPAGKLWDDSEVVRKFFRDKEGRSTQVPISYEEWDCTAFFKATIYAKSFALLDSAGKLNTLHELYVKPSGSPHGGFHSSVVSPSGNQDETFAFAIDQLRLLRNSVAHSTKANMDRKAFNLFIHRTKEALKALGHSIEPIDAVEKMTESDFPTSQVIKLTREIYYLKVALGVGVGLLR